MTIATLSPKFQIAIPKQIRAMLGLDAGMKFQVLPHNQHIELIPLQPIQQLRGLLKGMDTTITRPADRL